MVLDVSARQTLELTQSLREGRKEGPFTACWIDRDSDGQPVVKKMAGQASVGLE